MALRKPLHLLVAEHADALLAFFRRRIGQRSNAPDLVQEVFVRMLTVRTAHDILNPEAYLFTVAANIAQQHAALERRLHARQVDLSDPLVIEMLTGESSVDRDLDTGIWIRRLRAVVRELPPRYILVLKLYLEDELSCAAIGERLGVSKRRAAQLVGQAVRQCRNRLAQWNEHT